MSTYVKPTAKGQITLKKGVMAHMGVGVGDQVEVFMLPGGRVQLELVRAKKPISSLFGLFEPRPGPPVTDEEIQAGIAQGAVDRYLRSMELDIRNDDEAA